MIKIREKIALKIFWVAFYYYKFNVWKLRKYPMRQYYLYRMLHYERKLVNDMIFDEMLDSWHNSNNKDYKYLAIRWRAYNLVMLDSICKKLEIILKENEAE